MQSRRNAKAAKRLMRIRSRLILTGAAIAMVFGCIAGVLWYGAHALLDGTLTTGTLGRFVVYCVVAATSKKTVVRQAVKLACEKVNSALTLLASCE